MEIVREQHIVDMIMRTAQWGAGYLSSFHWHKNIEIIQPVSSSFRAFIDGTWINVHPGDIIVIDANTIHRFETTEPVLAYLWQINPRLLLSSDVRLKPIKIHITSDEINNDTVFSSQLSCLYKLMESGHSVKSDDKNPFLQSVFSAFYFGLMMKFPGEETENFPNEEKQIFYRIAEYINLHYTEDITVQSMAQSMFISRGRISSIFEKYAGMSINTYKNSLRINKANELFGNGIKDITEVTYLSGFQTIRTFNNTYKKLMGITPSEYIRKTE